MADWRHLSAIAALIVAVLTPAAAAATSAQAAPDSDRAVLDAFRAACTDLSSLPAAEAAAVKAGFAGYTPDPASPVAQLLHFGKMAANELSTGDATYQTAERVMRRAVAGRQLDLMLTDVTSYGTRTLGCRMVDFSAPAPIPLAAVRDWAGAAAPDGPKPTEINQPELLIALIWPEGGLFPGHYKSQVAFVPQDSALKETLHLSGINLMTQARN